MQLAIARSPVAGMRCRSGLRTLGPRSPVRFGLAVLRGVGRLQPGRPLDRPGRRRTRRAQLMAAGRFRWAYPHRFCRSASCEPRGGPAGNRTFRRRLHRASLPAPRRTRRSGTAGDPTDPNAIPGSWGGHCVFVPKYDQKGFSCITWGGLQQMTIAFWNEYCDEAHTLLSRDWLGAKGSPARLDLGQLEADLQQVTS